MKRKFCIYYLFIGLVCCCASMQANKKQREALVSLAGKWSIKLDPDSLGEKNGYHNQVWTDYISLPGTLDEGGYGTPTSGSDYGILSRRFKYIGPAWYTREIEIPRSWGDQEVMLYLERVMWESKVWIDGTPIGLQEGLGTPHYHKLGVLKPGKHRITVRVNNDMIYNIGDKGHSYGEYTQIIWNGMLGRMELQPVPSLSLASVKVWPDVDNKRLAVSFNLKNRKSQAKAELTYRLKERATDKEVLSLREVVQVNKPEMPYTKQLEINGPIKLWDDMDPNLYELEVSVKQGKQTDIKTVEFGFRTIEGARSKIRVNNRPVFMRGNLDCLHFPLTGYPPCDVAEWERIFRIYKSYGMNHVRFHSWCPPQAAFTAADRIGIYIQAEVLWIDWWMSIINKDRPEMTTRGLPKGLGHNPSADAFVPAEMHRMIEAYGNHPSFAMLCIGNELGNSDFKVMQEWIIPLQKDNRRLYAVSTARTIMSVDQYMATHNIPNIGGTYGNSGEGTDSDRESIYAKATLPILAHELGQYPVYPLWSEIKKYTGVLEARNLEGLRLLARKNGVEHQDRIFHEASGALQSLLYKGLIENLVRTASCGGFQMLSMTDYSGQGEALVGWLDSFWDSKGIITPEQFRCYSNDVVPLARFKKYVWRTDEVFKARIQVANYGKIDMDYPVEWVLTDQDGKLWQRGKMQSALKHGKLNDVDSLAVNFAGITRAGKYKLDVTIANTNYHNSWEIWVYPSCKQVETDVLVKNQFDQEAIDCLQKGGKVLLLAHQLGKEDTSCPLHFEPLFWSNSFFPGQNNKTLGAWIDKAHPALAEFPTDSYTNWQWRTITRGRSFVINTHPELDPIVQPISDFHINDKLASVFECRVGSGKLLVCGYDLTKSSPVSDQLKYSLLSYMGQSNFNPSYPMPVKELQRMMFFTPKAVVAVPKGFENSILYVSCGVNAENAGSTPWYAELDQAQIQDKRCKYNVSCDDVWKDAVGCAWTGREIKVEMAVPNGVLGDLYVKFEDWNNQNRAGIVSIEGRESILEPQKGKAQWVKLFVMREDTNDGKITFKARATQGGNLMISGFAFQLPNK